MTVRGLIVIGLFALLFATGPILFFSGKNCDGNYSRLPDDLTRSSSVESNTMWMTESNYQQLCVDRSFDGFVTDSGGWEDTGVVWGMTHVCSGYKECLRDDELDSSWVVLHGIWFLWWGLGGVFMISTLPFSSHSDRGDGSEFLGFAVSSILAVFLTIFFLIGVGSSYDYVEGSEISWLYFVGAVPAVIVVLFGIFFLVFLVGDLKYDFKQKQKLKKKKRAEERRESIYKRFDDIISDWSIADLKSLARESESIIDRAEKIIDAISTRKKIAKTLTPDLLHESVKRKLGVEAEKLGESRVLNAHLNGADELDERIVGVLFSEKWFDAESLKRALISDCSEATEQVKEHLLMCGTESLNDNLRKHDVSQSDLAPKVGVARLED